MSDAPDLQLYDSAAGATKIFRPIRPGQVSLYLCGPTVTSFVAGWRRATGTT